MRNRTMRRSIVATASAALVASTFAVVTPVGAAQTVTSVRISGADRYETSAELATEAYPGTVDDVIVATGENFPDALAASALAGAVDGPILLVPTDGDLPDDVEDALDDLDPDTVHVLGGEAAVSAEIATEIEDEGYDVNRISGADRYETAVEIAETIGADMVADFNGLRTAFVVTGENFADALAAGPAAFAAPVNEDGVHPILLTRTDSLPEVTATALADLDIEQVVVLGGTAAVSDDVLADISESIDDGLVLRLAGADRFETAAALAAVLVTPVAEGGFGFDLTSAGIVIADLTDFPDALAASAFAGSTGAPILGVRPDSVPSSTAAFLDAFITTIGRVTALGGTAAISDDVLNQVVEASTLPTPTATFEAPEGAEGFEITFSEQIDADTLDEDDFVIADVAPDTEIGSVTVDASGLLARVTLSTGELDVGDVITLSGESVTAQSSAFVGSTSITIEDLVGEPEVESVFFPTGGTTAVVTFSRAMDTTTLTDTANYQFTDTSAGSTAAVTSATALGSAPLQSAVRLTLGGTVETGDTLELETGLTDTAGNSIQGQTLSPRIDNRDPALSSATATVTTTQGSVDVGNPGVTITARRSGSAAGAVGNAFTFSTDSDDEAGVEVDLDDETVTITVDDDDSTTVQELVAELNGDDAFEALFIASANGSGPINGAAFQANSDVTFSDGTPGSSNAAIRVMFSEGIDDTTVDEDDFAIDTDGDGDEDIDGDDSDVTFTIDAADAFDGMITLTAAIEDEDNIIILGTSELMVTDSISDLAGNVVEEDSVTIMGPDTGSDNGDDGDDNDSD